MDFDGIPLMSIGFMIPPGEAVIWRGPMLHSAITTFIRNTDWGELDYLIIDMPPGTGDIALSLSQLLPLTGSVIVCTPQEVALIDAVKAVGMFRKVKIPVIGLIENMSSFICPDCSKSYNIFGKGGAKEYAQEDNIPFLGEIPLNIGLRQRGDQGKMVDNFEDETVAPYLDGIAKQLVSTLADNAAKNPVVPQLFLSSFFLLLSDLLLFLSHFFLLLSSFLFLLLASAAIISKQKIKPVWLICTQ